MDCDGKIGMATFFGKGISKWKYGASKDDNFSLGDGVVIGIDAGKIKIYDENGNEFILEYFGAGAGLGAKIPSPTKIVKESKLLGKLSHGVSTSVAKYANKIKDFAEKFEKERPKLAIVVQDASELKEEYDKVSEARDKGRKAGKVVKDIRDDYTKDAEFDDDSSDSLLERIAPKAVKSDSGVIYVGAACTGDELQVADFGGTCCYGRIEARLALGGDCTALFLGVNPIHLSRTEALLAAVSPAARVAETVYEVIANAKAAILFRTTSLELEAALTGMLYFGHARCMPYTDPAAPPRQPMIGGFDGNAPALG
jgi:hypothetical protein